MDKIIDLHGYEVVACDTGQPIEDVIVKARATMEEDDLESYLLKNRHHGIVGDNRNCTIFCSFLSFDHKRRPICKYGKIATTLSSYPATSFDRPIHGRVIKRTLNCLQTIPYKEKIK